MYSVGEQEFIAPTDQNSYCGSGLDADDGYSGFRKGAVGR